MLEHRPSLSLQLQSFHEVNPMIAASASLYHELKKALDMSIFQEILDLDTPTDFFSRDIVNEFSKVAAVTLDAMDSSLKYQCFSALQTNAQSLRCAAMVLGLTLIERSCLQIENIIALGVDFHYSGVAAIQTNRVIALLLKDARIHFLAAREALSAFFSVESAVRTSSPILFVA